MTREEKEQTGKYVLQMARLLEDGCYQQEMLLKAVHIIDEALEQEPKIVPIAEIKYDKDKIKELMNKTVLTVIPQEPRWISVSERLPEPNANDGLIARHYLIQNEYEDMLVARYDGIGWEQMYQHEYLEDDVIAWMPLPAPYEPQESEDV